MAGKNKLKRIKIIDECLSGGRKRSWEELQEACEAELDSVSERTIKEDIREMRSGELGFPPAPIISAAGKYFYGDKEYTIYNSLIASDETLALIRALDILTNFEYFEQTKSVKQIVDKLKKSLGIEMDSSIPVVHFEDREYPAGIAWIAKLYPICLDREPQFLSYQSFKVKEPEEFKIIPLALKEFNGRWYLIAYNIEVGEIHNYALDRIKGIRIMYLEDKPEIDFNINEYFKDIIGVTRSDNGPVVIRFSVSKQTLKYLETKPIHHSQKCIDAYERIFEIYVHENIEMYARLLSFGENVKILSPKKVRKGLTSRIQKAIGLYDS